MYNVYKKILILLLFIITLMPSEGSAESCLGGKISYIMPLVIFEKPTEIFHGKIIEIKGNDVKFEVLRVYNGKEEKYKIVDNYNSSYMLPNLYMSRNFAYPNIKTLTNSAKLGDEWLVYGSKITRRLRNYYKSDISIPSEKIN